MFPFLAQRIPEPAEHGERHMCVLEHRLGLHPGAPAAAFRRRQPGQNPAPDVEVAGNGAAAGIANRELRDLHQAGFDCVYESEVTHHPRERPVGVLPHAAQIVGGRREVDALIDTAVVVDAVEAVDPDRGLPVELLAVVLAEQVLLVLVRLRAADAIGVMGLVVHDQDVALAPDLAAEHAFDQLRVALDVAERFHRDRLEVPLPVQVFVEHGDQVGRLLQLEILRGQVARPAHRRRPRTESDGLPGPDLASGTEDFRRLPRDLEGPRLEHMPVGKQHVPPARAAA